MAVALAGGGEMARALGSSGEYECPSIVDTGYTDAETLALYLSTIFSSALSLAGTAFILVSYYRFSWLRTSAFEFVAFLNFTEFITSANYLLGATRYSTTFGGCPDVYCLIHAAVTQYFTLASMMWTSAIAYNLFTVFQSGETYIDHKRIHVACWGVPAVLLFVACGSLGDAGLWCWIDVGERMTRVVCFYVPLLATLLFNAVVYQRIRGLVHNSAIEVRVNTRIRHYLLVFCVCNFFMAVNRFQSLLNPFHPWFVLNLLQAFFGPLQGFGNAVVYGFNSRMRSAYSHISLPGHSPRGSSINEPLAPGK